MKDLVNISKALKGKSQERLGFMKVVSQGPQGCYFDHVRRRPGDVFNIPDMPRRKPSEKEAKLQACKDAMDTKGTVPEAFTSIGMRKAGKGAVTQVATNVPAVKDLQQMYPGAKISNLVQGVAEVPQSEAGSAGDSNSVL